MVGGMVSEGRQCRRPPRLVRGVPPSVCSVVPLNGGSGVCVVPRVRIGGGTPHIVAVPLTLSCLSSLFVWCRVCCGWGSAVVCAEKRRVVCVMNSGVCVVLL